MRDTGGSREIDALAERLHRAHRDGALLDAATTAPDLDMGAAYAVQRRLTRLRIAGGRRVVGHKLGYTSDVMRRQMGVDAPNHGPLFDDMIRPDGARVHGFRQPRVEPEVGVVLGRDLSGTGLGVRDVADAVRDVAACLEIVDSTWRGYRFSAAQNTADGSSAAGVVVGASLPGDPLACDRHAVELVRDGDVVGTGTAAAAGGHPLSTVAWLCAQLARDGSGLRAGDLVITGGLTAAVELAPGSTIEARFDGDGPAVRVTREPARPAT